MADNVHGPTMKLGICIALGALVWICFGESARFDWVRYDDGDYVYRSGRVTSGLNLQSVIWSFTNFHAHNWHPITTLSHMLNCQLFGVTPAYAETGRFADAIETATRGRRLAERESNRSFADEFAANISRYQQHLPLRDISLQLVDE